MDVMKITVLVFTYNQERFISRALDSINQQIDYVDEIIVSDDCSTDDTWKIVNQYKARIGEKLQIRQNEVNYGINKHLEILWRLGEGDVYFILAGDDEFCEGVFKKTIEFINENDINFLNEPFVIYFDFLFCNSKGHIRRHTNQLIEKHDAISLKIRNLIYNRTTAVGKNVVQKLSFPNEDFSCFADGLIDIQIQLHSRKNYYCPFDGSIYHTGIGIGSRTNREEVFSGVTFMLEEFIRRGYFFDKSDLYYLKYRLLKYKCYLDFSCSRYFSLILSYLRMYNPKYPIRFYYDELRSVLSVLKNKDHTRKTVKPPASPGWQQ